MARPPRPHRGKAALPTPGGSEGRRVRRMELPTRLAPRGSGELRPRVRPTPTGVTISSAHAPTFLPFPHDNPDSRPGNVFTAESSPRLYSRSRRSHGRIRLGHRPTSSPQRIDQASPFIDDRHRSTKTFNSSTIGGTWTPRGTHRQLNDAGTSHPGGRIDPFHYELISTFRDLVNCTTSPMAGMRRQNPASMINLRARTLLQPLPCTEFSGARPGEREFMNSQWRYRWSRISILMSAWPSPRSRTPRRASRALAAPAGPATTLPAVARSRSATRGSADRLTGARP